MKEETECFIPDNYSYLCCAEEDMVHQDLDDYEADETYTLEFVEPVYAITKNRGVGESPHDQMMFEREARVLELLIAHGLLG